MKIAKKLVMAGMAAFILGAFMGCEGSTPTDDEFIPEFPGKNELGVMSENLVKNGDGAGYRPADKDAVSIGTDGATLLPYVLSDDGTLVEADEEDEDVFWQLSLSDTWGNAAADITKLYGQGKSYLVKAKVRKDPLYAGSFNSAQISFTVYSGGLEEYALSKDKSDWEWGEGLPKIDTVGGPWDGEAFTSDDYDEVESLYGEEIASQLTAASVTLSNEWQEICVLIPSTAIESIVRDSGLYELIVTFCAGDTNKDAKFSCLFDDFAIIDLNSNVKRLGATWQMPNEEEEGEGEVEGEGGES